MPLILSLAPAPTTYKRNYLVRDSATAGPDDFDIVTELVFPDRAAYQNWVSTMYAARSGIADDEMNFLDRTRTRSYVVEEHVTDNRSQARRDVRSRRSSMRVRRGGAATA